MTADRLRQAADRLQGLSREFWDVMTRPPLDDEQLGSVINRIADAGFDTPEMALLVSKWLEHEASQSIRYVNPIDAEALAVADAILGES